MAAGAAVGTNSGTLGFRAPSAATAEAVTAALPSFLLLLTATETVGMPVVTAAVDEAAAAAEAVKLAAALAMGRDSAVTGHLSGSIFGRNCGEREKGEIMLGS